MRVEDMTAVEIAKAVKNGELKCTELVKELFSRIREVDKDVQSYITLCEDKAMEQAELVDKKVANGEPLGKLAGVPIAIV